MSQSFKLEVIAFDIESCIIAEQSGVYRIELCDNQADGGTTPSYGFIKQAREKVKIELFPIIRPRGGDFLYSDEEFEMMKNDIDICKQLGCDGIVTGILKSDGTVDKDRMKVLVNIAYPMSVTFHRAFDRTKDPFQAMEDIIEIGCERILTSGQKSTAMEGIELISELIIKAENRIIIMPGSGIKSDNIIEIAQRSNAIEFHSSARTFVNSKMEFNQTSMNETLKKVTLNQEEVEAILKNLSSLNQ